jgi:short-subunit dehydrogenase
MTITGKVVVVTGAAEGIGAAAAREFQRRGALLALNDTVGLRWDAGRAAAFVQGDIADDSIRHKLVEGAISRFGRIDILINNVGIGLYRQAWRAPLPQVRRMYEVNVFAALGMAQLVAPLMVGQGEGIIINMGSVGALTALPWATMYCNTKAALYFISEGLRRELKAHGVRVITMNPGIVSTRFREHTLGGNAPEAVKRIKRMVQPEAIARRLAKVVESRGSVVYEPRIGRLFALLNQLAPGLMDWYLARKWNATAESPVDFALVESGPRTLQERVYKAATGN